MKRMPFPLAKLAYMAIRQISKPLAVYIKKKAKTTPFLRNYILLPPAQSEFLIARTVAYITSIKITMYCIIVQYWHNVMFNRSV